MPTDHMDQAELAEPYRPRVAFTRGSIAKVVTARRRYVCGNHLSGVEKHYIEPGQRHVSNALPPHNSEIGNENWWYLRVCLDCCPSEHDPRPPICGVSNPETGERCSLTEEDHYRGHVWATRRITTPPGQQSGGGDRG